MMRKKSRKERAGDRSQQLNNLSALCSLPTECIAGRPITASLLTDFWNWVGSGANINSNSNIAAATIQAAAVSDDVLILHELAKHDNHWVRMALVNNQATPLTTLWGDGKSNFGLASDTNVLVKSAVLIRFPRPPAELLTSLIETVSENSQRRHPTSKKARSDFNPVADRFGGQHQKI